MIGRVVRRWFLVMALVVGAAIPAAAQNYEILEERLDADRHGYTVMRVWGSHYDMGYGMGVALADDIMTLWSDILADYGYLYDVGRNLTEQTAWLPEEIEDELAGIVDGVKSVLPEADFDVVDLKMANILSSDLAYYGGCRAHACWGSFVAAPVKTLATRRLDFSTPFPSALHHVLCAWDPDDGSVRWVNMGWPGMVTAVTAVNAYGTQVSTHDFGGASIFEGVVPRVVATRYVLTGMGAIPVGEHLEWARSELDAIDVATSSFLNYFAPEGLGGVFTCAQGGSCGQLRVPQDDYFSGEVLITTNSQTTGHQVPAGGQFMHDYYEEGSPKDLEGHFELMGSSGLHLVSVAYRGYEDMTILAHGRGRSDFIRVEWNELFGDGPQDGGPVDGGTADGGPVDGGVGDAGQGDEGSGDDDGNGDGDANGEDEGGGCGCGNGRAGGPAVAGLLVLLLLGWWARRVRC